MSSPAADPRALDDLSQRLTQALQILDLEVDYDLLLRLADETTQAAGPGAGAISTFLVGYAAGMTSTSGKQESADAVQRAVGVARQAGVANPTSGVTDGTDEPGWANSAQ